VHRLFCCCYLWSEASESKQLCDKLQSELGQAQLMLKEKSLMLQDALQVRSCLVCGENVAYLVRHGPLFRLNHQRESNRLTEL
jgi:hypothetical protein